MRGLLSHAVSLATDFNPGPEFDRNPAAFAGLLVLGFIVGAFGHLIKSVTLILIGIGMIVLATFVLPLVLHAF